MSLLAKLRPLKQLRKVDPAFIAWPRWAPTAPASVPGKKCRTNPISLYGKSKLAQEKIFRELCPAPYVIIRAPIVFGPGDMDMLAIFRIVNKGILPTLGRKERRYSVIYVKDLVGGMIAAANSRCENEIFYIANPEPISWETFMRTGLPADECEKNPQDRPPGNPGSGSWPSFPKCASVSRNERPSSTATNSAKCAFLFGHAPRKKVRASSIFNPASRSQRPCRKPSAGTRNRICCKSISFFLELVIPA